MGQKLEVGSKFVSEDVITATQLQRLSVTLNRHDPLPKEGDAVPWGWHRIFFPQLVPNNALWPDGSFSEYEAPLPRLMFAGNELRCCEPLRVGDRVTKETFVKSITSKAGRSGKLMFVTYGSRIIGPRGLALEEDQKLVYREQAVTAINSRIPDKQTHVDDVWQRKLIIDPVMLFRYSASVFNSHRIHYDHPYATKVEKYPDLVVSGGLTALLLLELVRENWSERAPKMAGCVMRAMAPLYANHTITLQGAPSRDGCSCRLRALDNAGNVAMELSATFN